ncbi:L-lactate permease [Chloroflexota bacterium]
MDKMLELNIINWLLAFVPLLVLLATMIGLKWSAFKAGTAAWIVAGFCGWFFFGADGFLLAMSCAKGLSLSLFVLLVIWSAVFMYNLIERLGAIGVIGNSIARLTISRLGQALLLGWAFSGFMQGIAGFGVPVAVIAPLMLMLGFSPIMAAATVLVGHSWAVTFGSMGSSYYAIQLVTGIPGAAIGPAMAILFALPIVATGFAVAHIEGGWQSVRNGALAILIVGVIMAFSVWLMAFLGAAQIASVVPGLIGCGAIWLLGKTSLLGGKPGGKVASNPEVPDKGLSFHLAFLPYYLLIFLTVLSQLPPLKEAAKNLYFGLNYPALETSLGYVVEPATAYAKIRLLNHPAPLILAATFLTFLSFLSLGRWKGGAGIAAFKVTVRQCVPTSLGIATMVMMALIMTSTGMTELLANGIARVAGVVFPIFSPYIGVLGCFMTGSNTNSNMMFGALQMETAMALGISPLVIASVQSIGGSLGSAIAPAKVLIGSTLVGLVGREAEVMRRTIPYCLVVVLFVGLEAWLAAYIFS